MFELNSTRAIALPPVLGLVAAVAAFGIFKMLKFLFQSFLCDWQ